MQTSELSIDCRGTVYVCLKRERKNQPETRHFGAICEVKLFDFQPAGATQSCCKQVSEVRFGFRFICAVILQ